LIKDKRPSGRIDFTLISKDAGSKISYLVFKNSKKPTRVNFGKVPNQVILFWFGRNLAWIRTLEKNSFFMLNLNKNHKFNSKEKARLSIGLLI
jgi:hypothetical protein